MERLFFRHSKPFERNFLSATPPFTFCHSFERVNRKKELSAFTTKKWSVMIKKVKPFFRTREDACFRQMVSIQTHTHTHTHTHLTRTCTHTYILASSVGNVGHQLKPSEKVFQKKNSWPYNYVAFRRLPYDDPMKHKFGENCNRQIERRESHKEGNGLIATSVFIIRQVSFYAFCTDMIIC